MTAKKLRKSTTHGKPIGASNKLKSHGPALLEKLRNGMPVGQSCAAVGVDPTTYHHWLRMGEENKHPIYAKFYKDALQARAEAVERYMGYIERAAPENWTAAAWLLERTHPNEFGKRNPDVAVAIQTNTVVGISNSPEVKNLASELCSLIRKATDAEYKEENE